MIAESAFLGDGVYVEIFESGSVLLSYGGPGAPSVALSPEAVRELLVFLKVESLHDAKKLRRAARLEMEEHNRANS